MYPPSRHVSGNADNHASFPGPGAILTLAMPLSNRNRSSMLRNLRRVPAGFEPEPVATHFRPAR